MLIKILRRLTNKRFYGLPTPQSGKYRLEVQYGLWSEDKDRIDVVIWYDDKNFGERDFPVAEWREYGGHIGGHIACRCAECMDFGSEFECHSMGWDTWLTPAAKDEHFKDWYSVSEVVYPELKNHEEWTSLAPD